MIEIRMARTARCNHILWILFLLEVDKAICKGVTKHRYLLTKSGSRLEAKYQGDADLVLNGPPPRPNVYW